MRLSRSQFQKRNIATGFQILGSFQILKDLYYLTTDQLNDHESEGPLTPLRKKPCEN